MVTLAPGYIAIAKPKEPLSTGLQSGETVVVEGVFDGVGGSLGMSSAGGTQQGGAQLLILNEATLKSALQKGSARDVTKEPAIPALTASATPASSEPVKMQGAPLREFDTIVRRIGAAGTVKMIMATRGVLLEDRPQQKRARQKLTSTLDSFGGRGPARADSAACVVAAYSDQKAVIELEAEGSNASNARVVSTLVGTVAKVYCDLKLSPSGIVIPNGSALRRETNAWVSFNDAEVTKRLDQIK